MNPENLEKNEIDLQKELLRKYKMENPIVIDFTDEKEKVFVNLKNEMKKCRGFGETTDIDYNSTHPQIEWLRKNGEVYEDKDESKKIRFEDCHGHLADEKKEIDERLIKFLYNEFVKHSKVSGIIITSGWRCPGHNKFSVAEDISGETSPTSLHMNAEAVDFILIGKNGLPLSFSDYEGIIIDIKKKYVFEPEDWEEIYQTNPEYLTYNNKNMVYIGAYEPEIARDIDNKHRCAYIHLDFRGIDPNKKPANYYYKRAGLI